MLIEPIVKELYDKYRDRVAFGRLNIDENPSIASRYRIMSIPTLILFRNGAPLDMLVGAMPKEHIERWLKSHL